MKYGVYAIRDNKVGFMNPFIFDNDATASRWFENGFSNPSALVFTHPADYDLYKIGSYNSETGTIESQLPEVIHNGVSAKLVMTSK